MIICFSEDLLVINNVLTNKNIFDTNNVVCRVGGGERNKMTKRENSKFHGKKIIEYNNYGVKIYLTY